MTKAGRGIPEWQKELVEKYEQIRVGPDDPVYEYGCIRCGGICCFNTDVLINPYDVWRIVTDDTTADLLGINTSHDLYTPANRLRRPLMNYYLGPSSGLPLACINMIELNENLRRCPFLAPVKIVKSKEDKAKLALGRLVEIGFLEADTGGPASLCVLEKAKPTVCRAYPLGRMGTNPKAEEGWPKMEYIWVEAEHCKPYRKPGKKMTVMEYVRKHELDRLYAMSDEIQKWHEKLSKKTSNPAERLLAGLVLYDFDLLFLPQLDISYAKGREVRTKLQQLRPCRFDDLLDLAMTMLE